MVSTQHVGGVRVVPAYGPHVVGVDRGAPKAERDRSDLGQEFATHMAGDPFAIAATLMTSLYEAASVPVPAAETQLNIAPTAFTPDKEFLPAPEMDEESVPADELDIRHAPTPRPMF